MNVLVVYATRAGSTAEVAQAIAQQLCASGVEAVVREVGQATQHDDLSHFGAVVLGSAIRYGAWLPEMSQFIESHAAKLRTLPTALFTLHMQALGSSEADRAKREGYAAPARQALSPRSEVFFAGKVDPGTLSWLERMAVKLVKSPVGDKRDWAAVRAWAGALPAALAAR